MPLFWKKAKGKTLSVDVGSAANKILVSEGVYPDKFTVHDYRIIHVSTTGKPVNPNELPNILKDALASLRVRTSDVRATLLGRQAVVRVVEMPKINREELKTAAGFNLNRFIPLNPDEAVFDCAALAGVPAREGWQKCILVAARRTIVDQHNELFRAAGIPPLLLDVEPVAVMNAFIATGDDFDRERNLTRVENDGVALVHLGASHTDLCILRGHVPMACRTMEFGANEMVQELATVQRLEYAQALQAIQEGTHEAVRPAVEKFIARVANEVTTSLGYCQREFDLKSNRLYVSGGPANNQMVTDLLQERSGIATFRFDPFLRADLAPLENRISDFRAAAATFTPALGLAVRSLGLD